MELNVYLKMLGVINLKVLRVLLGNVFMIDNRQVNQVIFISSSKKYIWAGYMFTLNSLFEINVHKNIIQCNSKSMKMMKRKDVIKNGDINYDNFVQLTFHT